MINHMVRKLGSDIDGHLMMDEIKMKNGIIWYYINNEMAGFVEEDLNTKAMIKNILGLTRDKQKREYYCLCT